MLFCSCWFSAAIANIADLQVLLLFVSWSQNSSQSVIWPPMGSLSIADIFAKTLRPFFTGFSNKYSKTQRQHESQYNVAPLFSNFVAQNVWTRRWSVCIDGPCHIGPTCSCVLRDIRKNCSSTPWLSYVWPPVTICHSIPPIHPLFPGILEHSQQDLPYLQCGRK